MMVTKYLLWNDLFKQISSATMNIIMKDAKYLTALESIQLRKMFISNSLFKL